MTDSHLIGSKYSAIQIDRKFHKYDSMGKLDLSDV